MDGIVGRLLREFSLTLTFAIVVSTVVSLTITPMICAHYIKEATSDRATWFDRLVEGTLSRIVVVLHLDAAGGAGLPVPDPARVLCDHRADGGALYQDPEGLFPDRRQRLRDRRDARIPRHLVPGDARAAAATGRHRDGRSGGGRHRLVARRQRRSGRRRLQPRHHVHQPEAAGGAGGHVDRAGDRSPAQEALPGRRASACSCSRRRISAPADGRAIPTISIRCRAPTSICCRNGRRWSPSAWRPSRASPTFPATAIPAGCNCRW